MERSTVAHPWSGGYFLAFASAIVLSTTGILISYLTTMHGLPPLILAFWRNGILAICLLIFLELFYPRLVVINRGHFLYFAGFGIILAIFNVLWTTSVAVNGAAVATVLVYSSVIFTVLLSRLLLGEQLNRLKMLAVLVASAGCMLVLEIHPSRLSILHPVGIGTGIGSGIMYGLYTIAGRSILERGLNPWTTLCYSFGFAAVYLAGFNTCKGYAGLTAATDLFWLKNDYIGWTALIVLALGPTLVGFGLYNLSLVRLEAGKVNLIAATEPAFTAVFAYLLLGEILGQMQILGGLLIFGSIFTLRLAETGHQNGFQQGKPREPVPVPATSILTCPEK